MPDLSTRTARRRLPTGPDKRWVRVARGRALGYRKPAAEAGVWYVRLYAGGGAYRMATLGTADDSTPSDNEAVLSYGQASTRALDWKPDEEGQQGKRDAVTVGEAVEHYLDWYRAHRKAYDRIRSVFDAHILPELGDLRIDALER